MKDIKFHVSATDEALSSTAAEWITRLIEKQLTIQEQFTWVLSGGSTPKKLYQLLASGKYRNRIDWNNIHVFFGDERYVPSTDEKNNGKMARDSLLSHVPIPERQVHYINTIKNKEASAKEYETLLHKYFNNKTTTFDLVLLGMGDDGHTLSLFPNTPAVEEKDKWVITATAPVEPVERITLTSAVVNKSEYIAFLVNGSAKAPALKEVIEGTYDPARYPSQIIHPLKGELHLFADTSAVAGIKIRK